MVEFFVKQSPSLKYFVLRRQDFPVLVFDCPADISSGGFQHFHGKENCLSGGRSDNSSSSSLRLLILSRFTSFLVSALATLYWMEESPYFCLIVFLLLIAIKVSVCIHFGRGSFTGGVIFLAVSMM